MNEKERAEKNEAFERATPEEILAWAINTHRPRVGLSSSFGADSMALIHMAVRIDPEIPILFLDTGFLFPETIEYKNNLKKQFKLNIREFSASPDQIAVTKRNLETRTDPSGPCCDETKVDLMKRSLEGISCWIAGLKRGQSASRKNIKIVETYGDGLIKVHPLANWTSREIYQYMKTHNLPFHPLWEKGYKSIGCAPCTRLPLAEGDDRSGRWAGTDRKECGIHTFLGESKENPRH